MIAPLVRRMLIDGTVAKFRAIALNTLLPVSSLAPLAPGARGPRQGGGRSAEVRKSGRTARNQYPPPKRQYQLAFLIQTAGLDVDDTAVVLRL